MSWTIRSATTSDANRLALIGSATFLETFAGTLDGEAILAHCNREHRPEAYLQYLEAGGKAWLAEMEPGRAPIGFALLGKADLPGAASDGSDIELKRIYILSRFNGQGLGAELMGRAVDEARARGGRRLVLGVYHRNDRAIAFYRKIGFVPIGERRFHVGEQSYDDLILARPLISVPD